MRTTDSCLGDYYERKVDGDDAETYSSTELLEVIAHELCLIKYALQKIAGDE